MRSLKIIIFRDTDKPYTMILSSSLLIGISFSILALVSLLTFSVMSNVMLYAQGGVVKAASSEPAANPNETATQPDSDLAAGGSELETDNGESVTPPDNAMAGAQTEEPVETTPEQLTDMHPAECEMEAAAVAEPVISANSITVSTMVSKRLEPGVSARGRFVAFLVDKDGTYGPSFPAGATLLNGAYNGLESISTFSIRYRRGYEVRFTNITPGNYTAIALCIFDLESHQLTWRTIVPLQS